MESRPVTMGNRSLRVDSYSPDAIATELIAVIRKEQEALAHLIEQFPSSAVTLVENILKSSGRLVISGLGKSGLVARKLVATFSSIGTPSCFLHPSDALHGDLGMVQPQDFVLVLSKSGTGPEFEQLFPILRAQGNPTALICCNPGLLQQYADLTVLLPFEKEACELNLAPTSSTTVMLAFGDALAVVMSKIVGFSKHDFARFHPGGALGKNLLYTTEHFMIPEAQLPFLTVDSSFSEAIVTITQKKLGVGIIIGTGQQLLGIITDGDLRRACERGPHVFSTKAFDIMTTNPKTVQCDAPAYRALEIMEDFNITTLVVMHHRRVVGVVHIHDLIKAGIRQP